MERPARWRFAVDRGGTFTDVVGLDPEGNIHTLKLLSSSPDYEDPCIEGIRRILRLERHEPLPEDRIETIRFGTTVATNALIERKGGRTALVITSGFRDLLEIGHQQRPHIFDLCIKKPSPLYSEVFEVEERIASDGTVIRPIDTDEIKGLAERILTGGFHTVAVVFLHSWKNPAHELMCEEILKGCGIGSIFLSHRTVNLIKVITRAQSTVVDAYLSPVIARYLEGIRRYTGNIPIEFIQSSGGLTGPEGFLGKDAILSGPSGGAIAVGSVAGRLGFKGAIGFDMGGTSTDVSRYDMGIERVYEQTIDGVELQTEAINIVTVASGGGSVLGFDGKKMYVGPESAGSYPGSACYGFGGPLTVTDANLLTGRIIPEYFPRTFGPHRDSPLSIDIVRDGFKTLTERINTSTGRNLTPEEVAMGFLRIANERMALAIKEISVSRGFDVRRYALFCFGGAGGQHACQIAELLGMETIVFHPLSPVMSAYGIGLARHTEKRAVTVLKPLTPRTHAELEGMFSKMIEEITTSTEGLMVTRAMDLRPKGTDSFITVEYTGYREDLHNFRKRYKRLFGFFPDTDRIEIVNIRVEILSQRVLFPMLPSTSPPTNPSTTPLSYREIYYPGGWMEAGVYRREAIPQGTGIKGPAFLVDRYSTLIVDPGFEVELNESGMVFVRRVGEGVKKTSCTKKSTGADPVLLEVFNSIFMNVAKEMGYTLRNTASSVNIKERLDFSCAIFDSKGNLIANAPHIPVHLGSMADTVKGVLEVRRDDIQPGDVFLTNNPYRGGSHLPDLTVVEPVFSGDELLFFTASRGHHADIGGRTPGSIPPSAGHIDEEGVLIDGITVVRDGVFMEEALRDILSNHRYPVRDVEERIRDIKAQIASAHKGVEELVRVIDRYGWDTVRDYMHYIQENGEYTVKKALYRFLGGRESFEGVFEDRLDDGTLIKVRILILAGTDPPHTVHGVIDFSGTDPQHTHNNLNTPISVTRSCVLYVLRAISSTDIPLNHGCLKPITLIVPRGSILDPRFPAPVGSGNVETSQRIVDVLLGALGICSASQGTMNNVLFEVEGEAPYYETIGGGAGAMQGCDGASGVHVHMTNTRITDPEILEYRHPGVRLERFSIRRGSGGKGRYRGGDGIVREIRFLKSARVALITERRVYPPYGLNGGGSGKRGENLLKRVDGTVERLSHRALIDIKPGESIVIKTPGGGGYGI